MASKKKNVEQRIAERKAFVQSRPNLTPAEARKRFYVQTRAAELEAQGKTVDRKALRQKFESGRVTREGFYTPSDIQQAARRNAASTSESSSNLSSPSVTGREIEANKTRAYAAIENVERQAIQKRLTTPKPVTPVRKKSNATNPVYQAAERLTSGKEWEKAITKTGKSWLGAGKKILGMASSYGESMQATFVNPAINLAGQAIGRKPNLREATGGEALLNTADVAATVYTAGLGKGLVPSVGRVLPKLTGRSRVVRGVVRAAEAAKTEAQLWSKTTKAKPTSAVVRASDYVRPLAPSRRSAVADVVENVAKKSKPASAATPVKAAAKSTAAKKAAAQPVKAAAKKTAAKKTASKKAASTSKSTEFSEMLSADVRQGDAYLYNPADDAPAMKPASRNKPAAKNKPAAQKPAVQKPASKKQASKKPEAQKPVKPKQEVPQVQSTSEFKSQEDFDKFMDVGGGKQKLQEMARRDPRAAQEFTARNARYIKTRQTRSTVAKNQRVAAEARRAAEVNARNAEVKKKLGIK